DPPHLPSFPTRRSSDLPMMASARRSTPQTFNRYAYVLNRPLSLVDPTGMEAEDDCKRKGTVCPEFYPVPDNGQTPGSLGEVTVRSEEHTSELQSRENLV